MTRLRLVGNDPSTAPVVGGGDPVAEVPLVLLMAASGRCSCADCCARWLAGDRSAGRVHVPAPRPPLDVVAG